MSKRRELPGFARVNKVTSASLGYPPSVFHKILLTKREGERLRWGERREREKNTDVKEEKEKEKEKQERNKKQQNMTNKIILTHTVTHKE